MLHIVNMLYMLYQNHTYTNIGPAKLVDRELGYIVGRADGRSVGRSVGRTAGRSDGRSVWRHLWPSWLHLVPSWLPKVSPDLQTDPQRLPETPRVQIDQNVEKGCDSGLAKTWFWMPPAKISFGAKCVEISFGFDAKSLSKWGSLKKHLKNHQKSLSN